MIINKQLAEQIYYDMFKKYREEDIVSFAGDTFVTTELELLVSLMRDPHIPLYVFEKISIDRNRDIQFTVRVINIGGDFAIYERTLGYHPQESNHDGSRREAQPPNQATTFQELVREGQELRRFFDAQTAQMRVITPNDMKIRSR